jgi:cytochrome c
MKWPIIFSTLLLFTSCGGDPGTKENSGTDATTAKTEEKDPRIAMGLELVTKSDCFTCHKLTENSIGPAYAAIATKYKSITTETMDSMVTQIIKGGAGRWGTVPMTPHPAMPKEDAEKMVYYIMSIKP